MSAVWYLPEKLEDPRAENKDPNSPPCTYEALALMGLKYVRFPPSSVQETEEFIQPLIQSPAGELKYDICRINVENLGGEEKFEALAKTHFAEHLHEDDEVRCILDGEGYFDVRDPNSNKWIRILTKKGDYILLPAGMYHRFITTATRNTTALRIFCANPKWVAINRPDGDKTEAREAYLKSLTAAPLTDLGVANNSTIFCIRDPTKFDTEMEKVIKATPSAAVYMIFVTGSRSVITGQSWCPSCEEAAPEVAAGVKALRQKYGEEKVVYVEAPVERSSYLGNPAYPHRTHPVLKVPSIPTVVVLAPSDTTSGSWQEKLVVKVRSHEPSAVELTSW